MCKIRDKANEWIVANSKEALAQELGISKPTLLARLEEPDTFTLGNAKTIARLTGCKTTELLD